MYFFKLFTFSVLCAKVLMASKAGSVTIDCEYENHEIDIKSYISQLFRIENRIMPDVWFSRIGRKSSAHIRGYEAMKKKNKGTILSVVEVLKYYEKIDKP